MSDQNSSGPTLEIATLAGGCFWCLEAVYDELRGVEAVQSGYMGGAVANPTYEQVCSGATGHAEVVQVEFNAAELSFAELLEVFFDIHDPTTLNRQGGDVGTQYRSAVYYHSDEQRRTAERTLAELTARKAFEKPIVTEVTAAGPFYRAEWYHDDYFQNNPGAGYCQFVISPKVNKFRKQFAEKRKPNPAASAR